MYMSLVRRMHVARIGMRTILCTLVIYMYCRQIRATCICLAKDIYMIRYFHHKMKIIKVK